ncbi:MAG: Slam-dependent surface lipoprotein [Pasteurellaceae bacterium]|nr:Slam-dependent surface lipoprotein [Pasteurellaceae bacterium]
MDQVVQARGGASVSQTNHVGSAYILTYHVGAPISVKPVLIYHYDTANYNYIEINGNRLPISKREIDLSKKITNLDIKDIGIASGTVPNDRERIVLFHIGNPTKNMPHQGKATYLGSSWIIMVENKNAYSLQGQTLLTADFFTKELNGLLRFKDIKPIRISANINHNNFTGNAYSNSLEVDAKVEGSFYGNNAASIAGIMKSDRLDHNVGWFGVFSGVKEKHLTPEGFDVTEALKHLPRKPIK